MPTSSPLNVSVTGSSISDVASATAASAAGVVSSGSTWVSAGESVRAPVSDAFASDARELVRVDCVARAGGNDAEAAADDDLRAPRLRQRGGDARRDLVELGPRDEHRVDDEGRRARVDKRAHPADEARPARVPERLLRRSGVETERLGGPDVVRLLADDDAHRRLQLRLAKLDAGQRPIPVVGVARTHRGHGRSGQAGEHRQP